MYDLRTCRRFSTTITVILIGRPLQAQLAASHATRQSPLQFRTVGG